jgi:GH24 family phage-related lysozyme (muramidase)
VTGARAATTWSATLYQVDDTFSLVLVQMSPFEFDAVVIFAYNIGIGAFRSSTLLGRLNASDFAGAADSFNDGTEQAVSYQLGSSTGVPPSATCSNAVE